MDEYSEIMRNRTAMILGEISESRRAKAEKVVQKFHEDLRVGAAELLRDANNIQKFHTALTMTDRLARSRDPRGLDIKLLYFRLGLYSAPSST